MLRSALGLLLHRSLACVRREPGEGRLWNVQPVHWSLRAEPLEAATSLGDVQAPSNAPQRLRCTAALELSLWKLPPRSAPLFFKVTSSPLKCSAAP